MAQHWEMLAIQKYHIPAQPADSLVLEICIKCAWFGAFLLENLMLLASPKCISIYYGPGSHKKNEGFSDSCEGWVPFLPKVILIILA